MTQWGWMVALAFWMLLAVAFAVVVGRAIRSRDADGPRDRPRRDDDSA